MQTEVDNPRRMLFLGPTESGVLKLLEGLTGTAPQPIAQPQGDTTVLSTAGLTHTIRLETKYYKTVIPVWLDETSAPLEWEQDFKTSEAIEVVRAIGAWIVVFQLGRESNPQLVYPLIEAVGRVIDAAYDEVGGREGWDGVLLAVSMGRDRNVVTAKHKDTEKERDKLEDICLENGFEYIDASSLSNANDEEKGGVARVKEALEANQWELNVAETEDPFENGEFDQHVTETPGFRAELAQMTAEFAGLSSSIREGAIEEVDQALQVEELATMMRHLQAARDMGAHLPEPQRRRLAAKAVNDLMKDIS